MRGAAKRAALLVLGAMMVLFSASALQAQEGEKKVSIEQVPPAVKGAILEQVGAGKLVDIGVYAQKGKTVYEIEMVVEGKEYDVLFGPDGAVLGKTFEGLKAQPKKKKTKQGKMKAATFQDEFFLASRQLATTGRNRFFILEPGYQLVLEGQEGDHTVNLTITVLAETRRIGGFETRVVEERESAGGQLVEISRNFLAICKQTKSVFYFGEEVDNFKGGQIIGHEGAWMHGVNGARAGLMMPGDPLIGASYYQEIAPGVAMDRARIGAVQVRIETPAGTFENCLKVQEENPLDQEKEFKTHAPGIGLVQDENLLLVRHGFVK